MFPPAKTPFDLNYFRKGMNRKTELFFFRQTNV